MASLNLKQLLHSPRVYDASDAHKGESVQVESVHGRPLFTATLLARGQTFSMSRRETERYEVCSPHQLTWARNEKNGEEYNLFARADDKGKIHYVYDPESEFHALVVMIGGQPRVRIGRPHFPCTCSR